MDMHVAGTIRIVRFKIPEQVNAWLEANADTEVINIQVATCESEDTFMIVYRIEL